MSEPFIGEIRILPYTFAPSGWALCNGQLLLINQYTSLYSIISITFGGDGKTTFGVPNLTDRSAIHAGQGPGLSNYPYASTGGVSSIQLTLNNLPRHTHIVKAMATPATDPSPLNNFAAKDDKNAYFKLQSQSSPYVQMSVSALQNTGTNIAHENMQPFQVMNYCICLEGIYPEKE